MSAAAQPENPLVAERTTKQLCNYDPGPSEVGPFNQSFVTQDSSGNTVSWDASAPMLGSLSSGVSVDWGANAAILFGRQKANISLRMKDMQYYRQGNYPGYTAFPPKVLSQSTQSPARARTVVVQNIGGFAGLSWHLPNAEVSFGYRADFFFGAIDGGLLTARRETRSFYGPFANVSIGLGE